MMLPHLRDGDITSDVQTAITTAASQVNAQLQNNPILSNPFFRLAVSAGLTVWATTKILDRHTGLAIAGLAAYLLWSENK